MKFLAVTSMNKNIYNLCGKEFINSFKKNWPKSINLRVYCEEMKLPKNCNRVEYVNFDNLKNYKIFFKKFNSFEKKKREKDDHTIKYQSIRFSKKVFSIIDCSKFKDFNFLIWLDADIVCYKKILIKNLKILIKENIYFSYLGRDYLIYKNTNQNFYLESGFMIFNLDHKKSNFFMKMLTKYYMQGLIYREKEWHDAYIFHILKDLFLLDGEVFDITSYYLSSNINKDYLNVFDNSYLGKFMKHKKGNRKYNFKN